MGLILLMAHCHMDAFMEMKHPLVVTWLRHDEMCGQSTGSRLLLSRLAPFMAWYVSGTECRDGYAPLKGGNLIRLAERFFASGCRNCLRRAGEETLLAHYRL